MSQFHVNPSGGGGGGTLIGIQPQFASDGITTPGNAISGPANVPRTYGIATGTSNTYVTSTVSSDDSSDAIDQIEDRTYTTPYVVDPSSVPGTRGTFTTITAAQSAAVTDGASASNLKNIYIRPGTYTEDLALVDGINYIALDSMDEDGGVTIIGNHTASYTGVASFTNIQFQNGATGGIFVYSGTNVGVLNINSCTANIVSDSSNFISGTNSNFTTNLYDCRGTGVSGSNVALFNTTGGNLNIDYTIWTQPDNSSRNIATAGNFNIRFSTIAQGISFQSTASANIFLSTIDASTNVTSIPLSVTGSGTFNVSLSNLIGNTGVALAIGSNTTIDVRNTYFKTNNATSFISGSSSTTSVLQYADLTFDGTAPAFVSNLSTTLLYQAVGAEAVTSPAGDLTLRSINRNVAVNTSAARTITLPATKVIGQRHSIFDGVGTAGTHNITVSGNGSNILGSTSASTYVMNTNGQSNDFLWTGSVWKVC